LISQDGDSDDVIDATKLAALLRGGYLREVHHSDDDAHVELKQWMGLYHDRVREAVRSLNKLRGRCRMFGHKPKAVVLRKEGARQEWLEQWKDSPLAAQMELLWMGYDTAAKQVKLSRKQVEQRVKDVEIVQRWQALPGVGLIRASTLYAYLETPWRFSTDRKLWKYCGVGLVRASSGKDKNGKPKVGHLELAWQVNRRLKDAAMGAATSAIRLGGNPFSEYYDDLCRSGITPGNARHTVARKQLSVMRGMWKTGTPYDPSWVRGPRNDKSQVTNRAGR
jgi:transposase